MDFFICSSSEKGHPGHRELCSRALASDDPFRVVRPKQMILNIERISTMLIRN